MSSSPAAEHSWRPDQLLFLNRIFGEFLKMDSVVNAQSQDGSTALLVACFKEDVLMAKLLLGQNADPHIANSNGHYSLAVAAFKGNLEFVKALVEAKADITFAPEKKLPAIHFAMMTQQYHIMSYLHKTLEERKESPDHHS